MKMSKLFRTRFGRVANRQPKNTLVTFRSEGKIYFGIARCNSELDTFDKNLGKRIATARAELAPADTELVPLGETDVLLHKSGLRGVVSVENVVQLIEYFREVDFRLLPEHLKRDTKAA